MKRTTKHVALDVHQATTVASIREDGGRVIARTILRRVGDFGNDGASLTELTKTVGGLDNANGEVAGVLRGLLSDISQGVLESLARPERPDYLPAPRSHLRRSSSATCA